jgi:hypothetical protein
VTKRLGKVRLVLSVLFFLVTGRGVEGGRGTVVVRQTFHTFEGSNRSQSEDGLVHGLNLRMTGATLFDKYHVIFNCDTFCLHINFCFRVVVLTEDDEGLSDENFEDDLESAAPTQLYHEEAMASEKPARRADALTPEW